MRTTRNHFFYKVRLALVLSLFAGIGPAHAVNIVVDQFYAPVAPGTATVDLWYASDVRPGGTATIQDLTAFGAANLNSAQPLPTGAARLTTEETGAAKAEVETYADFGLASTVLASINLNYSYYKTANTHPAQAPAIKLQITNPFGAGDPDGFLIYEPYLNPLGPAVPTNSWQTVTIDQNTGGGGNNLSGGWWWNGGFGVGSSGAGQPYKSLAEWDAVFLAADPTNFAGAHLVGISVGVGSGNPGELDYFDAVTINTGAINKTFDFQAQSSPGPSVPDTGSTLALLSGVMIGLAAIRRKWSV